MILDGLNNEYFEWMYRFVCNERYSRKLSYRRLMHTLHGIDFYSIIPLDRNRGEDGIELRYRFAYERGYDTSTIERYFGAHPCSVLEMLIALAIRCEEHIMNDPDIGNRTGQWFWNMIVNLNLGSMTDEKFDEDHVYDVISSFLDRKYKANGEGGLFTVKHGKDDLRSVEIWYQMCWYLDDIV